jgi:hypothetical protein
MRLRRRLLRLLLQLRRRRRLHPRNGATDSRVLRQIVASVADANAEVAVGTHGV